MPIFLVLFILLGFAAGVRTMLRTAQEIQAKNEVGAPAGDERE
jgi:ATP synthase protein I